MSHQYDPRQDPKVRCEIKHTLLNMQGENLASSHPSIPAEAQEAIDHIIEMRLRTLEGNEEYLARRFFEAVQRIPVVFNSAVESLIEAAMKPGCRLADIKAMISIKTASGAHSKPLGMEPFIDEWGYAQLPTTVRGLSSKGPSRIEEAYIPLDLIKAARNFEENLREALSQWDCAEGDLRRELLDDWCGIMNHRYEFELNGTITIDPPE